MRFWVISSDGQRYGPADVATLNQWAQEGRLLAHQLLEDETTGVRTPASSVDGLVFPATYGGTDAGYPPTAQQPYGGGQPGTVYSGAAYSGVVDDGSKQMTPAWIFAILSLLCSCCYLGVVAGGLGIYYSLQAKERGHPNAQIALVISVIGLVLSIVLVIAGFLVDTASIMRDFG